MPVYDLVIRNGTIIDGTGSPGRRGDVAVSGDRIAAVGQVEGKAAQTIDAKIAERIDSKAGLAARALDGSDEEVASSADVQLEALMALLTEALTDRQS